MFDARTRLLFFACLKDAAGVALKNAAAAPGSDLQKIQLRLRSRPKSGGSRRLRLRNTAKNLTPFIIDILEKLRKLQRNYVRIQT